MVWEDGVNWLPISPEKRGKYPDFPTAVDAVSKELLAERDSFFDNVASIWNGLFPDIPARPGKFEDGILFLYVNNAATNFMVRPMLPAIRKKIEALPGAPKKINMRLEIGK